MTAKKSATVVSVNPPILRKREAMAYIGLGETVFSELVTKGSLPKPIKIHDDGRAVGWIRSELDEWLAKRIAKRDAAAAEKPAKAERTKKTEAA